MPRGGAGQRAFEGCACKTPATTRLTITEFPQTWQMTAAQGKLWLAPDACPGVPPRVRVIWPWISQLF